MDIWDRLLNPKATGISARQALKDIQATWDDETRERRRVGGGLVPWTIPIIDASLMRGHAVEIVDEGEVRITTHTANRWRKSFAKTEHAALLCLELESSMTT